MKRAFTLIVATGLMGGVLAGRPWGKSHLSLLRSVHAMEGCSVETLRGSYGFYRTGNTPTGALGAVGVVTFDGNGGSAFRQTIRVNGDTSLDLFTDGAVDAFYSVNSDCTSKFLNPDGSIFGEAVIVDGGEEVYFTSLSDHNTITGVMKRINSHRGQDER
jgi:hypothetical protein